VHTAQLKGMHLFPAGIYLSFLCPALQMQKFGPEHTPFSHPPGQAATQMFGAFPLAMNCTVGHKSHDPCFHKQYMEAGVMTFVTHCTVHTFGAANAAGANDGP